MGTGGLVTIIPCRTDFSGTMPIGGINQEWIAQNVPLPGVYPARYGKVGKDFPAVYENPDFRGRNEGARTQQGANR
jgi:hypothetical protein